MPNICVPLPQVSEQDDQGPIFHWYVIFGLGSPICTGLTNV